MMLQELLSRVRQVRLTKREATEQEWLQLVRDCTAGVERDPAEVAELLERAGKTVVDLEDACRRAELRREKLALYATKAPAERELAKVNSKIEAAETKLQEHLAEHRKAMQPLRERALALEHTVTTADSARNFLCDPANVPPDIQRQIDALVEQRRVLSEEWRPLHESLSENFNDSLVVLLPDLKKRLADLEERNAQPETRKNLGWRIERMSAEVEANTKRLGEVNAELARVNADLDALLDQAMTEE